MGFFSWLCAECGKPILNPYTGGGRHATYNKVVALTKGGSMLVGSYDGYGKVGGFDLLEEAGSHEQVLYHQRCYTGQKYESSKKSKNDPGQGHFYNPEDLDSIFGGEHGAGHQGA